VAMLLAELRFMGLITISDHYRFVLTKMDSLLDKEFEACMTTFRHVERKGRKENVSESNGRCGNSSRFGN